MRCSLHHDALPRSTTAPQRTPDGPEGPRPPTAHHGTSATEQQSLVVGASAEHRETSPRTQYRPKATATARAVAAPDAHRTHPPAEADASGSAEACRGGSDRLDDALIARTSTSPRVLLARGRARWDAGRSRKDCPGATRSQAERPHRGATHRATQLTRYESSRRSTESSRRLANAWALAPWDCAPRPGGRVAAPGVDRFIRSLTVAKARMRTRWVPRCRRCTTAEQPDRLGSADDSGRAQCCLQHRPRPHSSMGFWVLTGNR